ncbi:hypothetical protein TRFO_12295 [Tritrichomonas foetus]|uniref:TPR Domain containing protein n=1 Tax=Tritrichomonas foetus TaxID=1144522 RepID=A0A1J4J5M2_9EUKA|nr:hypothetical protein TRFO_12295 [Tritrichomonas foetus]|eukprot:OHS92749.1 hypothetical protein TRFO_12295 [Tritrichomonas foetus]
MVQTFSYIIWPYKYRKTHKRTQMDNFDQIYDAVKNVLNGRGAEDMTRQELMETLNQIMTTGLDTLGNIDEFLSQNGEIPPFFPPSRSTTRNPAAPENSLVLSPNLCEEIDLLKRSMTPYQVEAFTLGNKAFAAAVLKDVQLCEKLAYQALHLDIYCIDAWRALCSSLFSTAEGDAMILALREVRAFFIRKLRYLCYLGHGQFYIDPKGRPYLRLLIDLGHVALESDLLDIAIYTYEELTRLDSENGYGTHEALAACYLKIIGRLHRFPNTQPKRDLKHLEALLNHKIRPGSIIARWAKIMIAWEKKEKNWEKFAIQEYSRGQYSFKIVFGEVNIDAVQTHSLYEVTSFTNLCNKVECQNYGRFLMRATLDWPNFVIDLHRVVRRNVTPQIRQYVNSNVPVPPCEVNNNYKKQMREMGDNLLNQARTQLSNRQFQQALQTSAYCKRSYIEAIQPSKRFYIDMPFAVVSNRATAAYYLGMYNLCRIDTRFTIFIKNDHDRSYNRIPKLLEFFGAKQIMPDAMRLAEKAMDKSKPKEPEEWKQMAREAIGYLSLRMIILSVHNKLTDEIKEDIFNTGIEDTYTPINVNADLVPMLPWLGPNDIEPKVV